MAEKKTKEKKEIKSNKTSFSLKFAFFMFFVTMLVFLPSTLLFAVCLIPTLVAYITDNHQRKTAWLTVGAMNVAGIVPIWFNLIETDHTIDNAIALVSDPSNIMISFGGALIGFFIQMNVTPFVAGIISLKNEARLRTIEKRQKDLIIKWGKDITK